MGGGGATRYIHEGSGEVVLISKLGDKDRGLAWRGVMLKECESERLAVCLVAISHLVKRFA